GGDDLVDGVNLNDIMAEEGSYRPGMVVLVAGGVAVFAGLILAATTAGVRPPRLLGVVLAAAGTVAAGWGLLRAFSPGDVIGVLPAGEAAAGAGPVTAAIAGLLVLAA